MSSVIEPTQTAERWGSMPLTSHQGQQGPVSTFQAGLSLTAGEKGFCPEVSTYVLQLKKHGGLSEDRRQLHTVCFVLHPYRLRRKSLRMSRKDVEEHLINATSYFWCKMQKQKLTKGKWNKRGGGSNKYNIFLYFFTVRFTFSLGLKHEVKWQNKNTYNLFTETEASSMLPPCHTLMLEHRMLSTHEREQLQMLISCASIDYFRRVSLKSIQ